MVGKRRSGDRAGPEGVNNLHILGLGKEKVEFITWG